MKITKAVPEDALAIAEFEAKCFPCVTDRFPVRNIRHQLNSKTCAILVSKDKDGKIRALITGFLRHFKEPSGRVYKIGVLPELQRTGIGSSLLSEIEKWFTKCGMKCSYAEVRESNKPSRGMFLKNGYKETKKLYGYYGNLKEAIELEDGVKYKKALSDKLPK